MASVDVTRGTLRPPIAPGEARNPLGRSGLSARAQRLARVASDHGEQLIARLVAIAMDTDGKANTMAQVRAAEIVLDRGYGKAADSLALQLAEEASAASVELSVTFRMGDRRPMLPDVDVAPVQPEAPARAGALELEPAPD